MDPQTIVQEYQNGLREIIPIVEKMIELGLERDKTKGPKQLLAQLNAKVCGSGTLLAGYNKAVRNIS